MTKTVLLLTLIVSNGFLENAAAFADDMPKPNILFFSVGIRTQRAVPGENLRKVLSGVARYSRSL